MQTYFMLYLYRVWCRHLYHRIAKVTTAGYVALTGMLFRGPLPYTAPPPPLFRIMRESKVYFLMPYQEIAAQPHLLTKLHRMHVQ
jgi:hypothetical protein